MRIYKKNLIILLLLSSVIAVQQSIAGPPFNTDDPQPVPFKHWEFYMSSSHTFRPEVWSGTSPHFEINYGILPNVQIHLLAPVNYAYVPHQHFTFGYAYTEMGIKYCFVQETDHSPQIGTFPMLEIPTLKNDAFSDGQFQLFLPVWVQKSWDKFTTYGGIGYWIKPGSHNRNTIFAGWEIQYDFSKMLTLGGELYYHSADTGESQAVTAFNIGGSINVSSAFHFIFSAGHSFTNDRFASAYVGLLLTI